MVLYCGQHCECVGRKHEKPTKTAGMGGRVPESMVKQRTEMEGSCIAEGRCQHKGEGFQRTA